MLPMWHLYSRFSKRLNPSDPEYLAESIERQMVDNEAKAITLGATEWRHLTDQRSAWKKNGRRDGFKELLRVIEAGESEGIVVWNLDRLLRRNDELEVLIGAVEDAAKAGHPVTIHAAHGIIDLSTPEGQFQARILVAVATKESDDKSRRVKRALADLPPRERSFAHDPANRAIVGWMADEMLAGSTLQAIATQLNIDGHVTTFGKSWTLVTVKRVLRNQSCIHVIGEAKWARVQEKLALRAKGGNGAVTHPYVLSGLLECTDCHLPMVGASRGPGKKRYICPPLRGGCERSIVAPFIEGLVDEWITEELTNGTLTRVAEEEVVDPEIASRLEDLDRVYWSRKAGMSEDDYIRIRSDLQAEAVSVAVHVDHTMSLDEYHAMTPAEVRARLPYVIEKVLIAASPGQHLDPERVTILEKQPRPARTA